MANTELKELLEAGAHFGHRTRRWNPKMERFIYGARGGVHIIDLTETAQHLARAADFAEQIASDGRLVLFIGTKRQARDIITQEARRAGMPYVANRWLGGTLTNWQTIKRQIDHLKRIEADLESGDVDSKYNKKEAAGIRDEAARLGHVLGGLKDMDILPGALCVIDTVREEIAVAEAKKLNIPVIAIADTNCDPDLIDYPIPANDDAIKSIAVICGRVADAALKGRQAYYKKEAAAEKNHQESKALAQEEAADA